MLVTSFTELGTQAPMIYHTLRGLVQESRIKYGEKRGHDVSHISGGIPQGDPDPAPKHEQGAFASSRPSDTSLTLFRLPVESLSSLSSSGSSLPLSAFRLVEQRTSTPSESVRGPSLPWPRRISQEADSSSSLESWPACHRWRYVWPRSPSQGRSAHQPDRRFYCWAKCLALGRHGWRCVALFFVLMFCPLFAPLQISRLVRRDRASVRGPRLTSRLPQVTSSAPALSLNSGLSSEDPLQASLSLLVRFTFCIHQVSQADSPTSSQVCSSSSQRRTPASTTRRLRSAPLVFLLCLRGAPVRRLSYSSQRVPHLLAPQSPSLSLSSTFPSLSPQG